MLGEKRKQRQARREYELRRNIAIRKLRDEHRQDSELAELVTVLDAAQQLYGEARDAAREAKVAMRAAAAQLDEQLIQYLPANLQAPNPTAAD